jgi:hypothetical protein
VDDLFSTRAGKARNLSAYDFAKLIWRDVGAADRKGLLKQATDVQVLGTRVVGPKLTEERLMRALRFSGVLTSLTNPKVGPPSEASFDSGVLFDILEFLHAEIVSAPTTNISGGPRFSQEAGQQVFRDVLNPDLALHDPPMEMLPSGQIVESGPVELRSLVTDPIPTHVPLPLAEPFQAALDQYWARDASIEDKRAALKHLADVLEPLRDKIDEFVMPADEQALFRIANRFHLRHNDRDQQRHYDKEVWLDWIFYVYAATARALFACLARDELRDGVLGSPPENASDLDF